MGVCCLFGGWNQIDGWRIFRFEHCVHFNEFRNYMEFKQSFFPIQFELVFGRYVSRWKQASSRELGRWFSFLALFNLYFDKFGCHLANKQCTKQDLEFRRLFGRWWQISGSRWLRRQHLHFTNHTVAAVARLACFHQSHAGMDGALDQFRPATKHRPVFVVARHQPARPEPHQLAKSSHAPIVQLQRLLPAQDPVKQDSVRHPCLTWRAASLPPGKTRADWPAVSS